MCIKGDELGACSLWFASLFTMTSPSRALPADIENQTHVTVHALLVGGFFLPSRLVFQDCVDEPEDVGCEVPFIAFMITHPTFGRTLFDLGMRKVSLGRAVRAIILSC